MATIEFTEIASLNIRFFTKADPGGVWNNPYISFFPHPKNKNEKKKSITLSHPKKTLTQFKHENAQLNQLSYL